MGKKRKVTAVPKFFGLSQSKRISFKVADKSNTNTSNDGVTINNYDIAPRPTFTDEFEITLNSTLGRPRIFTPEQTYNYKSAWKRYEKGRQLAEDGNLLEEPPNKYKCLSPNAPKGYWEIEKNDNPGEDITCELPKLTILPKWFVGNLRYDGDFDTINTPANVVSENYDATSGLYTATIIETKIITAVDGIVDNDAAIYINSKAGAFNDGTPVIINSKVTTNHPGGTYRIGNSIYTSQLVPTNGTVPDPESSYELKEWEFGTFNNYENEVQQLLEFSNNSEFSISTIGIDRPEFVGFTLETEVSGGFASASFPVWQITFEVTVQIYLLSGGVSFTSNPGFQYQETQIYPAIAFNEETFENEYSPNGQIVNNGFTFNWDSVLNGNILNSSAALEGTANETVVCENTATISFNSEFKIKSIKANFTWKIIVNGELTSGEQYVAFAGEEFTEADLETYNGGKLTVSKTYGYTTAILSFLHRFTANFNGIFSVDLIDKLRVFEIEFVDGTTWSCDSGSDDEGSGGDGGNDNEWKCNCPDSSKKKSQNPNDTNGNELTEDDWSDTNAGAIDGQCKHIWAVRILRREILPEEIPTDMPLEDDPETDFKRDPSPKIISNSNSGFGKWQPAKQRRSGDKF
jgi:hypothetical protein